jgi:hypothetical protein
VYPYNLRALFPTHRSLSLFVSANFASTLLKTAFFFESKKPVDKILASNSFALTLGLP